MKTLITLFFIFFAFSAFSQVRVYGVEIPENINTIEGRVLKIGKGKNNYFIAIDYGQDGNKLIQYLVSDENRIRKGFNGWVQALNYMGENGFKLFAFIQLDSRLSRVDYSKSVVDFVMVRED